jgi:hypothetical protein
MFLYQKSRPEFRIQSRESAAHQTTSLPGVARRLVTFLASPRKVTKRRRTPIRHLFEVPCVVGYDIT